jgi:hypothetical protein
MAHTHKTTLKRQANNSAMNCDLGGVLQPSHLEHIRKLPNRAAFNQRGLFG